MNAEKLLLYLLMLSVLVVLHEWGHFIVARRNGVRVTDFAVGMGPTLLKWTSPRSGTNYRINLFPIGGYCQMKGEDGKSSEAEQQRDFRAGHKYDPDNFQSKTPLQRLAIVVAGPIMNFIVALVLLFGAMTVFGVPALTTAVGQLVPGYPAERAGLHSGDRIVAVDGVTMKDGVQLIDVIHHSAGKPLHLTVVSGGTTRTLVITPRKSTIDGVTQGLLGFKPVTEPQHLGPIVAARRSWDEFSTVVTATLGALGGLFTHPAQVAGEVSGPIGMARASAQAEALGPYTFLSFAALISISLGIFNLLPIPALDGGRGVFILVEMLRGRPVDPEKEALVHFGGFAVLIALMIAVSFHDVSAALAGKGAF